MKKNIALISITSSVVGHLIFIFIASLIWMPGVSGIAQNAARMFEVKAVKLDPRPELRPVVSQEKIRQLQFKNPDKNLKNILKNHGLQPQKIKKFKNLGAEVEKETVFEKFAENTTQPEDTFSHLKESVDVDKRQVVRKEAIENPDAFNPGEENYYDFEGFEIPTEFLEVMPAFTPTSAIAPNSMTIGDEAREQTTAAFLKENASPLKPTHATLDSMLHAAVLTYQDPSGERYYQISIYPSPEVRKLKPMPKEIVFLVDASLSIKSRRLRAFKKGLQYALQNLNEDDRFNIYVFKNKIIPFAKRAVLPTPVTIQEAMFFLDRLESSQTTNIYSAFLQTMETEASLYPSYITLLSDGKPTRGMSSMKLITEITRMNKGNRSIFAFSGGSRVNRFLLDFVAYPNRGWSEYAKLTSKIETRLKGFYDKIKDPLLTKVGYQLSVLNEAEAFPKQLPDIYEDTIFTIYGKYTDETKMSMRVLGANNDELKEFIFSGDISKASRGTSDIARYWALSKIYHLISKMTLSGISETDKKTIRELTERFDLEIPYRIAKQ